MMEMCFKLFYLESLHLTSNGDNLTLYKTLRNLNPSPYMYHLKQNNKTIIGASPEMLVRITMIKLRHFP